MLKLALILALGVPFVFSSCDIGWEQFNDFCFAFSPEVLDWYTAASVCQVYDSWLAQVDSQSKNDWIVEKMKEKNIDSLWTGGSNRYHNAVWEWVPSLKPITDYSNWHAGEPNNVAHDNPKNPLNAEHCMHIWYHYEWNDERCTIKMNFVCEKLARSSE